MNSLFLKISMLLTDIKLPKWVNVMVDSVNNILNPILIVASIVGIIYAIWVGVTFAKADSSDQRKEAKQKLITVIIGVCATIALISLFYWLMYMIKTGKLTFGWTAEYLPD